MCTNVQDSIVITKLILTFAGKKKLQAMLSIKACVRIVSGLFIFLSAFPNLYSRNIFQDTTNIYLLMDVNRPLQDSIITSRFLQRPVIDLNYPDTTIFDRNFLPLVYEGNVWDSCSFIPAMPHPYNSVLNIADYMPKLFSDREKRGGYYTRFYRDIVRNDMDLIKYTVDVFPDEVERVVEIKPDILHNLFAIEYDSEKIKKPEQPTRYVPKRKYWSFGGSSVIQVSQSHISENWYKGGTDNFNLLSVQKLTMKYQKETVEFNSSFEWKLNLYNYKYRTKEENDEKNRLRIGEEQFRIYSNFSLKAINNWSYSSNIEIKTQFIQNFSETNVLQNSFLSPLYINMGVLGMKFAKNKKLNDKGKQFNVSADISPLSVQYVYVMDDEVKETRFGIKEGKSSMTDFGSSINSTFSFNLTKSIRFSSRFKYFTNYDKVLIESENEVNLPLNRYFSTRIYCYLRFDDTKGLTKDSKLGRVQLNELLSFGFNYTW